MTHWALLPAGPVRDTVPSPGTVAFDTPDAAPVVSGPVRVVVSGVGGLSFEARVMSAVVGPAHEVSTSRDAVAFDVHDAAPRSAAPVRDVVDTHDVSFASSRDDRHVGPVRETVASPDDVPFDHADVRATLGPVREVRRDVSVVAFDAASRPRLVGSGAVHAVRADRCSVVYREQPAVVTQSLPVRDVVSDHTAVRHVDSPAPLARALPLRDPLATPGAVPFVVGCTPAASGPVRDTVVSPDAVAFDTTPNLAASGPRLGMDLIVNTTRDAPTYYVEDHSDPQFSGFTTFIAVGGAFPGPVAQYTHVYLSGSTLVFDQLGVATPYLVSGVIPVQYLPPEATEYDSEDWG